MRTILRPAAVLAGAAALALGGCAGDAAQVSRPGFAPAVPAGFAIERVAHVDGARELAATPNGDLLVGTSGRDVDIVTGADGVPAPPALFARLDDDEASGIALAAGDVFVGTTHGVWRAPYRAGARTADFARIASVRTQGDGGHSTTSVAVDGATLYASVGSSCNACEEHDPTRASIQAMTLSGGGMHARAVRIRNAVALAVDPATHALWAGVAGQDELEHGHPYETFDDVTAHAGTPDYMWPHCNEDRRPVDAGFDCSGAARSVAVFPAYETPIGAAFYPLHPAGAHAFPERWRGGAFVAMHGSWHEPLVPPRVGFVPMRGDGPATAVRWNDPAAQWTTFAGGYQRPDGKRSGRPTGVAVGPDGSLFIADDLSGDVYRVRPAP